MRMNGFIRVGSIHDSTYLILIINTHVFALEHWKITGHELDSGNVEVLCREEKLIPRKVKEAIFIKKEPKPTLYRDGAVNFQRFMILYWQHRIVLGHHQCPEVKDRQSVNIQVPSTEDGVWLL